MCFYYSINKKKTDSLEKNGTLSQKHKDKLSPKVVVNGFEQPMAPVIINANPENLEYFQWGLIPKTVTTASEASNFIKQYNTLNAKAETLSKSKVYSQPISQQRCLVLASGFFEWQHAKGKRIPYYISLNDDSMFAFAGIWDCWNDKHGLAHFTFSIITTQANELMAKIHNTKKRMPAILPPEVASSWLNSQLSENDTYALLQPIDSSMLKAYTIKPFLNLKPNQQNFDEVLKPFTYPKKSESEKGNQLSIEW